MSTERYEFKTFSTSMDGDTPDDVSSSWLEAVALGFHDRAPNAVMQTSRARNAIADGKTSVGVYDTEAPAEALDAPVGTFVSYEKTLNVGGGLLPAYLISAVTVRPTHRRRGILRRMMTDGLASAHEAGLPVAALTASEGTIYRRFGFGAAVDKKAMTIDTKSSFGMLVPASGSVEVIDPAKLQQIAPDVFETYHRDQIGSIGRQAAYADIVSGAVGENGEPDPAVRAALHYDESGAVDGYVSYKFAGWNQTPATLELIDLIAQTPDAFRGLWQFVGSIDLISRVKCPGALGNDLLPASLVDARVVTVTEERDHLWLRILDVKAALEARSYRVDGELTVRVGDSLGYAEGTYRLVVSGGKGTLTPLDSGTDSADVTLDVADLSAIFIGGVPASVLVDAGRIDAGPDSAAALTAMFAPAGGVYCTTEF